MIGTAGHAYDKADAANVGPVPTMSVEDTMMIVTEGRRVELAFAEWGARGLLATITVTEGDSFRAVNVRVDKNGTTEREALSLVRGIAKMLAGGLVLDGADLRTLDAERDGVTLLSSETNGADTVNTFRIRGAA